MKITDTNPSVTMDAYLKSVSNGQGKRTQGNNSAATGDGSADKVVLSPQAKEIMRAKELLDATPEIRQEKVAALKAQIENGTYKIDSDEIATKMIRESLLNESE
jgi:negative regulator of flagellin synthesis FlgM